MDFGIAPRVSRAGINWPRLRVDLCYAWRFGRTADLSGSKRFTELVQVRKLTDRDPRMTLLSDKIGAKNVAQKSLGREWIVPTLWSGTAMPDRWLLNGPVILKSRHGSNQYAILRQPPDDAAYRDLSARTARWIDRPYGFWLDEWAYRDVERGLMLESLLGAGGALPVDYKVYVFGGEATHVQVHLARETAHSWHLLDRKGTPLVRSGEDCRAPDTLPAMIAAAETLATGFSFARVDFYEVAGKPLFGEFCFYPGSGLDRFEEDWIDFELGGLWRAALAREGRKAAAGNRAGYRALDTFS